MERSSVQACVEFMESVRPIIEGPLDARRPQWHVGTIDLLHSVLGALRAQLKSMEQHEVEDTLKAYLTAKTMLQTYCERFLKI